MKPVPGYILLTQSVTTVDEVPVAEDFTISSGLYKSLVYTFLTSGFGYPEDANTPLDHVRITAVPSSGTLFLDLNGNDTYDSGEELADGAQVSKADLDAGNLCYYTTESTNTSFVFDCQ